MISDENLTNQKYLELTKALESLIKEYGSYFSRSSYLTIDEALIKLSVAGGNGIHIFKDDPNQQEILNFTSNLFDNIYNFVGVKSNPKQKLWFPIDGDVETPEIIISGYVLFLNDYLENKTREQSPQLCKLMGNYITASGTVDITYCG